LALGKPASQISTYFSASADRAIDGRQDTETCTNGHVHPWLSVDLGAKYDIGQIIVTHDGNVGFGIITDTTNLLPCNNWNLKHDR